MSGGNFNVKYVANAFVKQYYSLLHDCPEAVHKFYQESSLLGWPGADDAITSVTTLEGINEKIMSSDYKEWPVEIKTADAQESIDGGVVVAVTGCFTVEDSMRKNFSQTFFLAKQEKGFFVLNDILRFIDVYEPLPDVTSHDTESDQAAPTHDSEPANIPDHPVQESVSTHTEVVVEDGSVNEESGPSVINDTTAGVAVPKPSVPAQENVHPVVEMPVKVKEDAKKISYASVVSKASSVTSPTHAPAYKTVRSSTNANQQLVVPPVPKAPTPLGDNESKVSTPSNQASKVPTLPSNVAPKVSTSSNGAHNASTYAEARGIYIGGLPYNITKNSLIEVIRQFGPVGRINDCVQIRKHEDGFCCGFVEFESSDAAHRAVEAHHVTFGEKEAYITYKRSSNRGGNREGPSLAARGGFRNGNIRGRENGEGNNRQFQNGNRTGFRKVKSSSTSSELSTDVDHRKSENGGDGMAASEGGAN
ncbi:Nuclear transport factor 2 (NTF2) family protein with RNA binding (RRM-RBD-RNP motif) domain [Forsythia ovata]|uniref:Nuclear transport factor 2 (NTF2) family protein with RNA binding (RRM-RBD-RNP motif) domain n=1 Tax=Forsythia ovata TaxID=205694 RepID=A0ABD1XBS3_9LAMI